MNQPSSELKSPEKNMKRQPQTAKASPGKIEDVIRKMKDASNAPMPAPPPPTRLDIAPRQFAGTDSVPMVWVDATTPPTKMPCTRRRIRKMIGAAFSFRSTPPFDQSASWNRSRSMVTKFRFG